LDTAIAVAWATDDFIDEINVPPPGKTSR